MRLFTLIHISLLAIALQGCAKVIRVGGDIGGTVTEWIACPTDLIDCGHVYECATYDPNPGGWIEICIDDDADDGDSQLDSAEAVYGPCELTRRHQGLCLYGCDPHKGCNAFNGCWCP